MEIIGILILLFIGSAVVYYLDFQKTIWNAISGFFETVKKRCVEIQQDRRNRAEEKQARVVKKLADRKEKNRTTFAALQKIRELEKIRERERNEALRVARGRQPRNEKSEEIFQDHITVHPNGSISADPEKFLRNPNVQRQIKGMQQLFRQETLRALYNGKEPPVSVGKGHWTKKRLEKEWDDGWESNLEAIGLTYDQFFKDQFVCSPRTRLDLKENENTPKITFGDGDTGFYESTLILKSKDTSSGGPR